jgi:hypothetical protein
MGIKVEVQDFEIMLINDSLTIGSRVMLKIDFCGDGNLNSAGCKGLNCGIC